MKVLIVYDSVSVSKMTKAVAETISANLKEKKIENDLFYVEDIDKSAVKNYDCLIVGAPTMAFRPSKRITQFLDGLPSKDLKRKLASAFDTQLKILISGNAAKGIEKKLRNMGFNIFKTPLVVYVENKLKNVWQFKSGELEKVRKWTQEAADTLSGEP